MKFRTLLLLGIVLLIAGTLAGTVGVVAAVLQEEARRDIAAELVRSREAFEDLVVQRGARLRSEARVVAEEPRLKAVVATEDVSHETTHGVALELHRALGSDLFVLTDGEGRLLADVQDPAAEGFDLRGLPGVSAALQQDEAAGVWTQGERVYEVEARRLAFGTTPVGVLVIGRAVNDALADNISRLAGSQVVVLHGSRAVAASRPIRDHDRAALARALVALPAAANDGPPAEVTIDGDRHLALAAPLPGYEGPAALRYVVLRSLDRALAPATRISRVLYFVAAMALAAAGLLALALSRRLSRPLDALVTFTEQIAAGELDQRATPEGPVEVQALGEAMNRMAGEIAESREQLVMKERLEQELEISARIQTCILPRGIDVDGLEVAARMLPAAEVGGDYYDVLPVRGGTWIGIGDVAGHGLRSGLIMLMLQSAVAVLAREQPLAAPSELLRAVNRLLYDNIRNRLANDEHVTLTLIRYRRDGLITFAGAHEEIIVCRASTGRCELVPTPGPWVGAMEDIGGVTVDTRLQLEEDDVVVLYTDGITEARDGSGRQLGLEPIVLTVESFRSEPVERIRDEILRAVARWAPAQEDDMTLVVLRYRAPERRIA